LYTANIKVTLRRSILDPQGKTVENSIKSLGYENVLDTRIGKFIELKLDVDSEAEASRITNEICGKLLANPVMEDFEFRVVKLNGK
jgi:phosphoribosylformylglycinamidine synthase PurS subunit